MNILGSNTGIVRSQLCVCGVEPGRSAGGAQYSQHIGCVVLSSSNTVISCGVAAVCSA
jgi:hypothetical protein